MLLDSQYIQQCPLKERACMKLLSGVYQTHFRGVYGKKNSGYYIFEVSRPHRKQR